MADPCDVLIIGGGPSGSTAAALIAARGRDVVLLEKERHPRFHIGESLLPWNLSILERLGIREQVAGMGVLKPGAEFVSDETGKSVQFNFATGLNRQFTYSYQVRRADFDHLAFQNAKSKGARTFEQLAVSQVEFGAEGERARVTTLGRTGERRVFAPKLVLDASGRDAFLAKKFGLTRANKRNTTAAVFAHFRGVKFRTDALAGYITVHLVDGGWFWMIPLPGEIMSVGFVGTQAAFKNRRGSIEEFFFDKIRSSPTVSRRMTQAMVASEVTVTGNYSYCATKAYGEGFLIIGDAFAFVDPIFSTGVLMAMKAGEIAADVAELWFNDRKAALRMAGEGERRLRNSINKIAWFIYRINHPVFREMFMAPRDIFQMRAAVVSLLAGDFEAGWRQSMPLFTFKALFVALSLADKIGLRGARQNPELAVR